MDSFDKQFYRTGRMILVVWIAIFIASISSMCAVAFVAWHFISKVW